MLDVAGFPMSSSERNGRVEEESSPAGDFLPVYEAHYREIAGYLYRRTGDLTTAEDLASEVFLAALRNYSKFESRGIPVRHWLYRIATNAFHRRWRRNRWRRATSLSEEEIEGRNRSPSRDDEGIEEALRALQALSPKLQAVLTLHYLEELSLEEVSSILRIREGTVKSRLFRARAALRRELLRRRKP